MVQGGKKSLLMGLTRKVPLFLTNKGTSNFPSSTFSGVHIRDHVLPKENTKRITYQHILDDLKETLANHPNFRTEYEDMIQRTSLEGDEVVNLRPNSFQNGEDDTGTTMKINVWESMTRGHPRKYAKNVKLKLEPEGKFFFSATAGSDNVLYEVDLDLFDKINVDESKSSSTSRSIVYLVKKAEDKWWSRLIK
ncbi:hypothetical protein BC332_11359 [Capsicum chinense]|nr:hypothetical protein BC332_11359 [Capsicum chinense]